LELAPDLNLFIGLNNAGKSALLKAFINSLPDNPHKNIQRFRIGDLKLPRVEFKIRISIEELYDRFARIDQTPRFPAGSGNESSQHIHALESILNAKNAEITIECWRDPRNGIISAVGGSIPQLRNTNNPQTVNVEKQNGAYKVSSRILEGDNLPVFFDDERSESIFYFSPQRLNIARVGMAEHKRLAPDASNLPGVLAYVQGAQAPLFDEIESHVMEIMPGIERITVAPRGGNFEILIWPDRHTIYPELAFSLEDSGTGVGQLLAILTAVVLSEQSVIVIDEINTFLHASSVKKLLGLLKTTYSRHQYIISSHSAEVIGSAQPTVLYHVTRDGYKSSAHRMNLFEVRQAREIAGNLGFSMLDVFGFERIVWVEGPTEELIFPLLLEKAHIQPTAELGFCAVASTSAFSSRGNSRNQILEIYEKAGKRLAPLLKGMAFGLDRESLDDEAVRSLQKSRRKLRFLPRRCIENYFIKPHAIVAVLNDLGENATVESVMERINQYGGQRDYLAPNLWKGDFAASDWLVKVDGAKLLAAVFSDLSQNRVEFRKTRDSVSLATFLLKSDDEDLRSLIVFVSELRDIAMRDTAP